MTLELVTFPGYDIQDIPRGLRMLADRIEEGIYDKPHNLAWVIDCGNGRVELGLLGASRSAGAEGHLLFSLAVRALEDSARRG